MNSKTTFNFAHRAAPSRNGWSRVGARSLVVALLLACFSGLAVAQGPLEDLGPVLESGEPIDLSFPEPHSSHRIYRALERAFGVQITLDRHFHDAEVAIERRSVTLPESLDELNRELDAFYVVRGPRAVTVANDTPSNRRKYEPHYVARFRLRDVDPSTAMSSLRALVDVRKMALDEAGPTLIVRGSRATVQHAARVLEELDQPKDIVEVQVEVFAVDVADRLADVGVTLPTSAARAALDASGAESILDLRSTLSAGEQGRLEAASQPYVGRELGWEGVVVEHRLRALEDRALFLDARILGGCVSPTDGLSMRRDRREQTVQARIAENHSVLVLEPLPPAEGPIEGRGNTCGLLPHAATKRTEFALLITPVLRPASHRPLDAEAWMAGTESVLETVVGDPEGESSR